VSDLRGARKTSERGGGYQWGKARWKIEEGANPAGGKGKAEGKKEVQEPTPGT